MVAVILTILAFAIMVWVQLIPLKKRKDRKDLIIFSVFTVLALGLTIMHALGLDLPDPNKPVSVVVENLLNRLGKF
jgi:hypothetical protein